MPTTGYWDAWGKQSYNWKPCIELLYAFGRDHAAMFAPVEPLFTDLGALRGVEVPPLDWMRLTWLRVGFVAPMALSSIEVETFHEAVGQRLRRLEARTVRLGGIELIDNRVVLRVDDGGLFRDARREAARGLRQADEALAADPEMTSDGDNYMAGIDIAYLDANASEGEVIQAIDPYRAVDLGEVTVAKLMLARMIAQPEAHFAYIDIFAEILMAQSQRAGARS